MPSPLDPPSPLDLVPGQYQIGDLPMGVMTPFAIEDYVVGYDVNVQDYQIPSSNEINFGEDTLKATPLQFKINVLVNKWLPNMLALSNTTPDTEVPGNGTGLADLQREWDAAEVRQQWGTTKPLYFVPGDGVLRKFYGRPGKFAFNLTRLEGQLVYQCTAEYRRLDTYAYSNEEHMVEFEANTPQALLFPGSFGPAWVRIVFEGAVSYPTVNIGAQQLKVAYDVPIGESIEICSYPWQRRVINDKGQNLGPKLEGTRPYLSRLKMQPDEPVVISATAPMRFYWHDSYRVL